MQKVALLGSRPARALLQRRQGRSPPGGRHNSSPEGVLGAVQSHRTEGPTGTRNKLKGETQIRARKICDRFPNQTGRGTSCAAPMSGNGQPGVCIRCGVSCPRCQGRCTVCNRPLCSRACARAHEPRCRAHQPDEFSPCAPPRFVWPGNSEDRNEKEERRPPSRFERDDRHKLRKRRSRTGAAPSRWVWSSKGCPATNGEPRIRLTHVEDKLGINAVCLQCFWERQAGDSPRRCPRCD